LAHLISSGDGRMELVFSVKPQKDLMMNLSKNTLSLMISLSVPLLLESAIISVLLSKKVSIKSTISKKCGKMKKRNNSGIKRKKWLLKK
jgi:hypothetical protein